MELFIQIQNTFCYFRESMQIEANSLEKSLGLTWDAIKFAFTNNKNLVLYEKKTFLRQIKKINNGKEVKI